MDREIYLAALTQLSYRLEYVPNSLVERRADRFSRFLQGESVKNKEVKTGVYFPYRVSSPRVLVLDFIFTLKKKIGKAGISKSILTYKILYATAGGIRPVFS